MFVAGKGGEGLVILRTTLKRRTKRGGELLPRRHFPGEQAGQCRDGAGETRMSWV